MREQAEIILGQLEEMIRNLTDAVSKDTPSNADKRKALELSIEALGQSGITVPDELLDKKRELENGEDDASVLDYINRRVETIHEKLKSTTA